MRALRRTARVQGAPAPLVVADPRRVGELAAELVVNRLWVRPSARLLLPTGRSPQGMYRWRNMGTASPSARITAARGC